MLPAQARFSHLRVPECFTQWINIKRAAEKHYRLRSVKGMTHLLEYLKLPLQGAPLHQTGVVSLSLGVLRGRGAEDQARGLIDRLAGTGVQGDTTVGLMTAAISHSAPSR